MFRFTIRDVLWLMLVVAVIARWFGDRYRTIHRAERAAAEAQSQNLASNTQLPLTAASVVAGRFAKESTR